MQTIIFPNFQIETLINNKLQQSHLVKSEQSSLSLKFKNTMNIQTFKTCEFKFFAADYNENIQLILNL